MRKREKEGREREGRRWWSNGDKVREGREEEAREGRRR